MIPPVSENDRTPGAILGDSPSYKIVPLQAMYSYNFISLCSLYIVGLFIYITTHTILIAPPRYLQSRPLFPPPETYPRQSPPLSQPWEKQSHSCPSRSSDPHHWAPPPPPPAVHNSQNHHSVRSNQHLWRGRYQQQSWSGRVVEGAWTRARSGIYPFEWRVFLDGVYRRLCPAGILPQFPLWQIGRWWRVWFAQCGARDLVLGDLAVDSSRCRTRWRYLRLWGWYLARLP